MFVVITLTLAAVANLILLNLYRRADANKIRFLTTEYSNLAEHNEDLEAENRQLFTENRNLIYRIDELESRLRAIRKRQRLGLRAYDVEVNGLYLRHIVSAN